MRNDSSHDPPIADAPRAPVCTPAAAVPGAPASLGILILASFAALMAMLDLNIVRLAMPALSKDFHVDSSVVSWVQLIYILVLTCLLLVFGKLGDLLGYRRLFLGGLVVFTAGSLLCALAQEIGTLLAARAIQATGGAAMTALTTPLICRFLPHAAQGRALGIVGACESLGITLGRFLGGVLVQYLNWRWIFLINVPVGIAALALAYWALPKMAPARRQRGFDWAGAVLILLSLGPLLFAINMGDVFGWTDPLIMGAFAVALLSLAAFVAVETRWPDPLLDLAIFRNPNLTLAFVTSFVKFFIESGLYYLVPFYLMLEKKIPAAVAGLLLVIPAVVQMAVSPATGWLTARLGARWLAFISMALTSVSCGLFVLLGPESGYVPIGIAIATIGLSKGLFIAPNRHRIMDSAPAEKMGCVNGALETTTRAGVAFGICLFDTVFSSSLPERGADYLHAPAAVLEVAFRAAFAMGLMVSVVGLISSAVSFGRAKAVSTSASGLP
jgi:EmrB/QacA subfamily drug resistance transporter